MPVSLGVHIGQQNLAMEDLRAVWRTADEAGMDWISVWDHIYEVPPHDGTEPHFETVATLAALCADTRRARVGCLVFYVGYRNPALLAKTAATLDHLSGGRFELGLGAGWHAAEAKAYGYDFPDAGTRLDMLEEAVPMVRSLLTEDRTTHDGRFFRAARASNVPGPLQRRLPIWIGGVGERRTLRIAARYADGWNAAYVSAEEYGRLNGVLDHWCDVEGRDPAQIERSVNVMFFLATDPTPESVVRQRLEEQWGEMGPRVRAGTLTGTPDDAVDQVLAYLAAGADQVNVALRAPWDADAYAAYLTETVPAVRTAIS